MAAPAQMSPYMPAKPLSPPKSRLFCAEGQSAVDRKRKKERERRYFQAIRGLDLKSFKKIVMIFCPFFIHFFAFLMYFGVCKEQYHSETV